MQWSDKVSLLGERYKHMWASCNYHYCSVSRQKY